MAYLIKDVRGFDPATYSYYFFDANAWIAALKHSQNITLDGHEQPYVNFFEAIIHLHVYKGTPQAKKVKNFPKFIVTSLLLSEIVNAYMRNVAMKVFYASQGKDYRQFEYKRHYRPDPDHQKQLKNLVSDFTAFKDYIELRDDRFNDIDPFTILPYLSSNTDFNDFYYYYFLHGQDIPIVTSDGDFIFQDVIILTANGRLLSIK